MIPVWRSTNLDGAPGVYSARFAGEDGNDAKNNEKLLKLLDGAAPEARTARFVSVITMVYPDGTVLTARGEWSGQDSGSTCRRKRFRL